MGNWRRAVQADNISPLHRPDRDFGMVGGLD